VLGVFKDMNGDCAWRMLGECRCERLQIIMCDNIQFCIRLFENKLKLKLY